jgi:hypothetical protein
MAKSRGTAVVAGIVGTPRIRTSSRESTKKVTT